MDGKKAGGIVAAVSLTIAAAFVAIAILVMATSVTTAKQYAEQSSNSYSTEISSALGAFVTRQLILLDASGAEGEIVEALRAERNDTPADAASMRISTILDSLDNTALEGSLCVVSKQSHNLYVGDGVSRHIDNAEWARYWSFIGDEYARDSQDAIFQGVLGMQGQHMALASDCLLSDNGTVVGCVGMLFPESTLTGVIDVFLNDESMDYVVFSPDGCEIFSTVDDAQVGTDVFAHYPVLSGIEDDAQDDTAKTGTAWEGFEEPMPSAPVLYQTRRINGCNAHILTIGHETSIFTAMRTRVTTLFLVLSVVMILLLLLLMFIVRWYRTRLMKAATTDELTGLANRKWFSSTYKTMIEEGMGESYLALIDVDKFKGVNDTYGHAIGDKALAAVASEVSAMVGSQGIAGRWGGDEFIAVLRMPGKQAQEHAQRLIDNVARNEVDDGVYVSVSVGLAHIGEDDSLEIVVEHADDALYVTKEGGRGFLTLYERGVTPHMSTDRDVAVRAMDVPAKTTAVPGIEVVDHSSSTSVRARLHKTLELSMLSLLEAVHKMIPFVAGGGILIALAFLIDGASVDLNSLTTEARANFGSITPIAAGLKDVGSAAFNFMLPIFAAFFARALAGDEAFMAGFAGGFLSSQGSAGFAGAIAAAVAAAVVVNLMHGFIHDTAKNLQRVAPVLLYPVFSLLIMYFLMLFLIDPVASAFDALLTSALVSLRSGSRAVLGAACGALMATDMGGPINKAAYHFGTAAIESGSYDIMASVMVGGMVPPCGIALCMLFFGGKFTDAERDQGVATLFMGLSFITEGAIPFLLTDVFRVIPSCMLGSAVAGALSELFGCTLMAPHGGIFVFPLVGNAHLYALSLIAGSLVTALVLGLLKRNR